MSLPVTTPPGMTDDEWARIRADYDAFFRAGMPRDQAESQAALLRLCAKEPIVGFFARAAAGRIMDYQDELDEYHADGLNQWYAIGALFVLWVGLLILVMVRT